MNDEMLISKDNEINELSPKFQKNVNKSNTKF